MQCNLDGAIVFSNTGDRIERMYILQFAECSSRRLEIEFHHFFSPSAAAMHIDSAVIVWHSTI